MEDYIRQVIPASELNVIIDNIGLPNNINLARSDSVTAGPSDGEILIALNAKHGPTADYLKQIRSEFPKRFPGLVLFTQPADIVSQILNFGLPAPIDIRISGPIGEMDRNQQVAQQIATELSAVSGAVDVHIQQITDAPRLMIDTDRTVAQQSGLREQDIANDLSLSLGGSGVASNNFWLNYKNGVSYPVIVQTPQYRASSMEQLNRTPISVVGQPRPLLLSSLATVSRTTTPQLLSHYNVQPVFDVYANVQGTDLGSVSSQVSRIVAKYQGQISKASNIVVGGQVQSMNQSFFQMGLGICFAILLVYFLMVVNFQSWSDPLIILMALPGALAGILWALYITRTTINVPALMGCIMSIGVATSNSILMVTFANEQRQAKFGGKDARSAALIAGRTRLRPVLMTALAMLIGMLPMSLHVVLRARDVQPDAPSRSQNPYCRAGGLIMTTLAFHLPPLTTKANPHTETPAPPQARTRTIFVIAMILVALLAVFLIMGIIHRRTQNHTLAVAATQAAHTPPSVYVVHPLVSAAPEWSLPGTTQAMQDAIIYARVSGYLSLLAEIESPEIDQQLIQARANLQQFIKQLDLQKANLELARNTMERYKGADQEGAVAKLTVDQAVATYATAQASVAAAQATVDAGEATVRQFKAMTTFERVVAPFNGVVTQRNVDVGTLITAGSPTNNTSVAPTSVSGSATGMFEIAQTDTLRVFVSVPQSMAANVKSGVAAQVSVRGALNAPVKAMVTRTANALDPGTRTLLTEVDIPNSSRGLFPGQFVYVSITVGTSGHRWNLPATALIFNAQGTQVMLVESDGKLRLQNVTVGRDFGDTIDVQAGLSGNELIVKQPTVSLQQGQVVSPVESQNAPQH